MMNDALICINVTAILYSEYFDAFNQNANDALSMINILKNDYEYCKENKKSVAFNDYNKLPKLESFQIVTGNWKSYIRSDSILLQNYSTIGNQVWRGYIFPRLSIDNAIMITSTLQIPKEPGGRHILDEKHIVAAAYKNSLSQYYKYEPIIISATSNSISKAHVDDLPVKALKVSEVDGSKNAMNYLFLGSSHERYLYNAIIENLLNDSNAFMNLSIKHDHHTHVNASNFYMEFVAFAEHSAHYLLDFCNTLQTAYQNSSSKKDPQQWTKSMKNSIYNFSLILSSGAWDLQNAHFYCLFR
jgi:hypothetical protein